MSLDDLNKWGVSTNNLATTRCDTTELTVAQKLQCGLDPTDGRKFEVLSMRETSSGNIEVTVPRTYTPTGYSITYSAKNNSGSSVGSLSGVSVSDGKATMNFNSLGTTAGVTFITVEASVP